MAGQIAVTEGMKMTFSFFTRRVPEIDNSRVFKESLRDMSWEVKEESVVSQFFCGLSGNSGKMCVD